MAQFTKLQYKVENHIATIAMDSKQNMNAFDVAMLEEVVAALHLAGEDKDAKAVLLTSSSPKAFSAGGDIGTMYQGLKRPEGFTEFGAAIEKMASVTYAIKTLPKPVVGAIQGACAGAGFNVALACDYIIAADSAVFIQAFVKLGLIPDAGGFYLLTRSVGINKAMELALTGRPVSAQEAKALGFVATLVPDEAFSEKVAALMKTIACGPSTSYTQMKRLMWESEFKDFEAFVQAEVNAQTLCGETPDFKEGVFSFVEKRQPNFLS